ncbi:MAG: phospho-N-acetylmuramoyl-pentapeptide-transferase [Phycisphaerales bacterium]|nr:phospho-N-acetylmuramoyl-pentapeptide-transferase [Phycisphaerales bacterium]
MLYALWELTREWLRQHELHRPFMVMDQVGFRAFGAGVVAFALVLVFGRRVIRWLAAKKIGDQAKFDVAALDAALKTKANTPTMGGLLICGSIAAAVVLLGDLRNSYVQAGLIVLMCFAAIGGVDDWLKLTGASRDKSARQGFYSWEKLVFQLGIATLIGWFVYRAGGQGMEQHAESLNRMAHVLNLPFQKTYDTGRPPAPFPASPHLVYLGVIPFIILMVLMTAGMSNAVNITDGMDGLASGCAAIVSIGLVALCFVAGSEEWAGDLLVPYVPAAGELSVLAAALGGACLGFLWWNASPAAVFMGDTGSLSIGALLGYIAVVIRQEYVLLIMAGVFLLEITSVVLQVGVFKYTRRRYGEGRRVFRCAPYHWHLHMGGWPETKIVARFWILTIVLVAGALATLKLR